MPYSMSIEGMDELLDKMDKLPATAAKVAAEALYEGAGVAADAVSQAVRGIATRPFKYARNGEKRQPSPEEKAIVESAPKGVAKFRNNGLSVQTSVGFNNAGYGQITWNHARTNVRTKYKIGGNGIAKHASQGSGTSVKPIPLIVNSINSGTSFMEKQPFLRKAFSRGKKAAQAAIENGIRSRENEFDIS